MTTPIFGGPYVAPFKPLTNITPFTYRDGATYLGVLEGLRKYVNDELVEFVNTNFNELGDEFETQINIIFAQVAEAIENVAGEEVQDSVIEALIEDADSLTRTALNLVISNAIAAGAVTNSQIAAFVTGVGATKTALDAAYGGQAPTNSSIAAFVTGAGATKTALDAAYGNKVTATNLASRVYTTDNTGANVFATYSSGQTNNSIVQRTGTGQIVAATPTLSGQVATKGYVDGLVTTDASIAAFVNNGASATRLAIDALIAAIDSGLDESGVAALLEDEDSELRINLLAIFTDPTSDIRVALDAIYSTSGLDDSDIATLVNDTDSDTRTALDGLYGGGSGPAITIDANDMWDIEGVTLPVFDGGAFSFQFAGKETGYIYVDNNANFDYSPYDKMPAVQLLNSDGDLRLAHLRNPVGPTESRESVPERNYVGLCHFDTTLGIPVWLKTKNEFPTPDVWVDAEGNTV